MAKTILVSFLVFCSSYRTLGNDALIKADKAGNLKKMRAWITAGANINLRDKYEKTALMYASQLKYVV